MSGAFASTHGSGVRYYCRLPGVWCMRAVLGNAAVASSTVFDPALLSTWIRAAGLPELDRVAFGIGQPGEASVRVDLRVQFDRDASFAKLGDHLVEVADAEVDHPLAPPVAKSTTCPP